MDCEEGGWNEAAGDSVQWRVLVQGTGSVLSGSSSRNLVTWSHAMD